MSPEKARQLIDLYPALFSDLHELTCFSLFSFECEDGWFEPLKDLILEIKSIIEKDGNVASSLDDDPVPLKVSQVKEKYGTLCFYTSWITNKVEEAIEKAEIRSSITCELCGEAGILTEVGPNWYQTVCEKCFAVK